MNLLHADVIWRAHDQTALCDELEMKVYSIWPTWCYFPFLASYHVFSPSQMDLSDLDLETLAPYIPMDGEDFQLNPIITDSEPLEGIPAGSRGSSSNLNQSHQSFSNIASLFQPLSSPPHPQGHYQQQTAASWSGKEKGGPSQGTVNPRAGLCMMGHMQNPPYQAPASTPLSSMGGHKNLQWPPDPLLTYQQTRANKAYLMDTLPGEERLSCQQNMPHFMQKQRWHPHLYSF